MTMHPKTFRELFNLKNCSESFKDAYRDQCNVCRKTMCIAELLEDNEKIKEKLINDLNIDSEYLNEFLDAGCCDPEVTEKICRYLEIEVHNECCKKI